MGFRLLLVLLVCCVPARAQTNDHAPVCDSFDIGVMGHEPQMRYIIGETDYDERMTWYHRINKEYYLGKIACKDKKSALPWNYHAEAVENPDNNISTDSGRSNRARFVAGYRILIEDIHDFTFGKFKTIETIFGTDNKLLFFTANVDTAMYIAMTRLLGAHKVTEELDTILRSPYGSHAVALKKRTYTWRRAGNKAEVVLSDALNEKGMVKTTAVYSMMDTVKYETYLGLARKKKKQLEKEYLSKKK